MTYGTDTTTVAPTRTGTPSPVAPSHDRSHVPSTGRRWPGWAAAVASLAAAATLAVVVLAGNDNPPDTNPVPGAHSGLIEHGSIRSIEGSVEDTSPVPGAHSGLAEHGSITSTEGAVEDPAPARPGPG